MSNGLGGPTNRSALRTALVRGLVSELFVVRCSLFVATCELLLDSNVLRAPLSLSELNLDSRRDQRREKFRIEQASWLGVGEDRQTVVTGGHPAEGEPAVGAGLGNLNPARPRQPVPAIGREEHHRVLRHR